jgi:hypothetical protein
LWSDSIAPAQTGCDDGLRGIRSIEHNKIPPPLALNFSFPLQESSPAASVCPDRLTINRLIAVSAVRETRLWRALDTVRSPIEKRHQSS